MNTEKEVVNRACELLIHLLGDERIDLNREQGRADLLGHIDARRVVVEVKTTSHRGVDDLKGILAIGILQLRDTVENGAYPIVLIHAPRIGGRTLGHLEDFMRNLAPDIGWGAFDDHGTTSLNLPGLDVAMKQIGRLMSADARETTHNKRAFTDLNRWLLKVLMLHDAPPMLWHDEATYRQPIPNPALLQKVADVSQAKAYQFARTFRDLKLLRWDQNDFSIPERRRLFDLWYEEERQLRVERHPVRSVFIPGSRIEEVFASKSALRHFAIGGFAACSVHGLLHTQQSVPEIHIFKTPHQTIEAFDLEFCPDHEAELFLIEAPYRESVQRGVVIVNDLPVVDVLQAALDVAHHPQRGREQAEYIVSEVLGWT